MSVLPVFPPGVGVECFAGSVRFDWPLALLLALIFALVVRVFSQGAVSLYPDCCCVRESWSHSPQRKVVVVLFVNRSLMKPLIGQFFSVRSV